MSMTKAELEARVAELEAQNAQLQRVRSYGALFTNPKWSKASDPIETGDIRLDRDGIAVWYDISMWPADPARYESEIKPAHNVCLSPMPAQYAAKKEAAYQASKSR